jgi:hypothetical protein
LRALIAPSDSAVWPTSTTIRNFAGSQVGATGFEVEGFEAEGSEGEGFKTAGFGLASLAAWRFGEAAGFAAAAGLGEAVGFVGAARFGD